MDEKGVTGELRDPKFQDEAVRMAEYRQGNLIRDAIRRLIAASNAEECFRRAQSSGISWAMIRAAEENYDIAALPAARLLAQRSSTRRSAARFRIRAGRLRAMRCRSSRAAARPTWVSTRARCSRRTWGLNEQDIAALTAAGAIR